jgi:hypothetical protein
MRRVLLHNVCEMSRQFCIIGFDDGGLLSNLMQALSQSRREEYITLKPGESKILHGNISTIWVMDYTWHPVFQSPWAFDLE